MIIVTGIATQRHGKALAGAIPVALVCLLVEALLVLAQRVLTPAPIREFARATTH